MDKVSLIQLEMSLVELYKNEMLYTEMIRFMQERDFTLISLENGFCDQNTGQLLQVDGIFRNEKLHKKR
ncbi:hypothetical protein D3C85_1328560 [compost metagenome]